MTSTPGAAINLSVRAGPLSNVKPVSKGAKQKFRRWLRRSIWRQPLVPAASSGVNWGLNLAPSLPRLHWQSRSSSVVKAIKNLVSCGLHTPWQSSFVASMISGLQSATVPIVGPSAAQFSDLQRLSGVHACSNAAYSFFKSCLKWLLGPFLLCMYVKTTYIPEPNTHKMNAGTCDLLLQ